MKFCLISIMFLLGSASCQFPLFPQGGSFPGYPGFGQISVPLQPTAPAASSSESICGLKSFAEAKCASGTNACKRCVIDQVERSCPYNPSSGPPDCAKLKSCATGLTLGC